MLAFALIGTLMVLAHLGQQLFRERSLMRLASDGARRLLALWPLIAFHSKIVTAKVA
jgi:hypothetical protein